MNKETIIILDQELHTQWTLKTLLEIEDYNVIAVNSAERAMRIFSEFDVSTLITEYWVDHASTIETIREFKKMYPESYVMVLSNGELQEKEYEEIINAGTDDFFLKPFSMKKIILHIRKGLKRRTALLQKKMLVEKLSQIYPERNTANEAAIQKAYRQ